MLAGHYLSIDDGILRLLCIGEAVSNISSNPIQLKPGLSASAVVDDTTCHIRTRVFDDPQLV